MTTASCLLIASLSISVLAAVSMETICPARLRKVPETISSAAQAPAVIHQAIAAAYSGRGVAHLTVPQDVFETKAGGAVSSVATLRQRPEITPSERDVVDIAISQPGPM